MMKPEPRPAAPAFQRRYGKRTALLFGTWTWAGLQVLPILLRLSGWFPGNDSEWLVPILAMGRILQGACAVQANTAFGSAIADVADENELRTGQRQEGIVFATSSFSGKFASGIGSLLAGLELGMPADRLLEGLDAASDLRAEIIMRTDLGAG